MVSCQSQKKKRFFGTETYIINTGRLLFEKQPVLNYNPIINN